jgi:hypothetical protein
MKFGRKLTPVTRVEALSDSSARVEAKLRLDPESQSDDALNFTFMRFSRSQLQLLQPESIFVRIS